MGLVGAALLAWVTGVLGARLAQQQVVENARSTTELLAETVVQRFELGRVLERAGAPATDRERRLGMGADASDAERRIG